MSRRNRIAAIACILMWTAVDSCTAAIAVTATDWTSVSAGVAIGNIGGSTVTLSGLFTGAPGGVHLRQSNLTSASFVEAPVSNAELVTYGATNDWTASFSQPHSGLLLYAGAWRGSFITGRATTVNYTFNQPFVILSGLVGASVSGNTLSLNSQVNSFFAGIIQFPGATSVLSVDSQGGLDTSAQSLTFAVPILGSSQETPVLPSSQSPGGEFFFTNVHSGSWVDPPLVEGFHYQMTTPGSLFTGITGFPTGFSSPFTVSAGGSVLGQFVPGQTLTFPGGGVSSFDVTGIQPLADAADPLAFPLQLTFNTPTASFTMQGIEPVPEPSTLLTFIGLSLAALVGNMRSVVGEKVRVVRGLLAGLVGDSAGAVVGAAVRARSRGVAGGGVFCRGWRSAGRGEGWVGRGHSPLSVVSWR